jgi:ferredoxin
MRFYSCMLLQVCLAVCSSQALLVRCIVPSYNSRVQIAIVWLVAGIAGFVISMPCMRRQLSPHDCAFCRSCILVGPTGMSLWPFLTAAGNETSSSDGVGGAWKVASWLWMTAGSGCGSNFALDEDFLIASVGTFPGACDISVHVTAPSSR